jgi:anti-anti-sigma factor
VLLSQPSGVNCPGDFLGSTRKQALVAQFVRIRQRRPQRLEFLLAGDIDLNAVDQLDQALRLAAHARSGSIHVDLQQVSFFSATGLTFLVQLQAVAAARHAVLTVGPPPTCVADVITVAKLDDLLAGHGSHLARAAVAHVAPPGRAAV